MSADAALSVLNLHLKEVKEASAIPSALETSRSPAGTATLLTLQDWELLVKGVNVVQYEKGEPIIREGHFYDKIMQLGSGSVNIMKARRHIDRDKPPYKIGELKSPALFGETLFSLWKRTPAAAYTMFHFHDRDLDCRAFFLSSLPPLSRPRLCDRGREL